MGSEVPSQLQSRDNLVLAETNDGLLEVNTSGFNPLNHGTLMDLKKAPKTVAV